MEASREILNKMCWPNIIEEKKLNAKNQVIDDLFITILLAEWK